MTLAADHPRGSAPAVQLARLGFHDPARAERLLGQTGLSLSRADTTAATADSAAVIDALSATADPDLALLALSRLAEASAVTSTGASRVPLVDALRRSPALRQRLIDVLAERGAGAEHVDQSLAQGRRAPQRIDQGHPRSARRRNGTGLSLIHISEP